MNHPDAPGADDARRARRQLLRRLVLLRFIVNDAAEAFARLASADQALAARASPFGQPIGALELAVGRWLQTVRDAFTTAEPALAAADAPLEPRGVVLARAPDGRTTFATLLAAFERVTGKTSLAHLAAADFALTAAEDQTAWSTEDQSAAVLGLLRTLQTDVAAAASAIQAHVDEPDAPPPGDPHAAIVARGSPFARAAFAPNPTLASITDRTCGHCERAVPELRALPVCEAMMIVRDLRDPRGESEIAGGYVSVDGWFFTDTESPAGFLAACTDEVDVAADVRPFDARYYDAYLEQFGNADAPIGAAQRHARMMAILRYDPFGPPR